MATTPVVSVGTDYSEAVSNLNAYLVDKLGKDNVRGFSVGLVDGGQVVWVKGFGQADPATQRPTTGDTLYRLGAASELFHRRQLKVGPKGLLDLDQPLAQVIPGFSIKSRFKKTKPITPRSLLAQPSGLPGFFYRGMWGLQPSG